MKRLVLLAAVLWPALAPAADEEPQRVVITSDRNQEWASYRHAYTAAAFFAKYTNTRPLIQAHMQIRPFKPDTPLNGLLLRLKGAKTDLEFPVDAIGRATIPMLKQAYDEDAVLRLNRQRGHYYFSGRYSIKEREDGVYTAADLRLACDQLIDAQRQSGYRFRVFGKKCEGIKFVYPADDSTAAVAFQQGQDAAMQLPASLDHPFDDRSMGKYKVVTYRFTDWPADGVVTTAIKPLAIGTLYN